MVITEVVDSDFGFLRSQVLRGSYEQVNDFFGQLIDLGLGSGSVWVRFGFKQDAINAHAQ